MRPRATHQARDSDKMNPGGSHSRASKLGDDCIKDRGSQEQGLAGVSYGWAVRSVCVCMGELMFLHMWG